MDKTPDTYKQETIRAYDAFPDEFEEKFGNFLERELLEDVELFLGVIPRSGRILDIGSGTGNQALYFAKRGYDVTCIDLSEKMIERCKEKGLRALLMDYERMEFFPGTFDGVWAYCSLIHSPKKNLPRTLETIKRILRPRGAFFLGMKQGQGEGFRVQDEYPGVKRYFALYENDELQEYFKWVFIVQHASKTEHGEGKVYLNYLLNKK